MGSAADYELLKTLTGAEAEDVLTLGNRIALATVAELFRLGAPADHLYIVDRGRLSLTLPMQVQGREQDVQVEERLPGQTVGWSGLIPPYRFTLKATGVVALGPKFAQALPLQYSMVLEAVL